MSYDANGNLLTLLRAAPAASGKAAAVEPIDALTYRYGIGTNRLLELSDEAQATLWEDVRWDADPSVFAYSPGGAVTSRLSWWATGGANEQAEETYEMVEADEAERPVTEHGPGVVETMNCVGQVCAPAWQPVVSHTRYGLDGYRLWHTTTATEGAGRRVVRDGGATVGVFSASGALVEWVLPGGLGRLEGPTLALRYALRDHLGTAR